MSANVSCRAFVLSQEAASETFWPTKLKDLFPGFPEMFTSPCSMPGYLHNGHRARRLRAQARGKWGPTHRWGLEARNGAKGSQHGEGTQRRGHTGKQEPSLPNFKTIFLTRFQPGKGKSTPGFLHKGEGQSCPFSGMVPPKAFQGQVSSNNE